MVSGIPVTLDQPPAQVLLVALAPIPRREKDPIEKMVPFSIKMTECRRPEQASDTLTAIIVGLHTLQNPGVQPLRGTPSTLQVFRLVSAFPNPSRVYPDTMLAVERSMNNTTQKVATGMRMEREGGSFKNKTRE